MANVGGYQLIGKIGQGGMATVFKGTQLSLNRPVAIKVLSRKLADHYDVLQRFNRESLIIARLAHPNIITVIDRGITSKGMPYFVMEYVEGTDLAAMIRNGDLDYTRKVEIVIQVCRALSYAHKNGVIHRDIKPGNIVIDAEGTVRVLDFGIAQLFSGDVEPSAKTQVGLVMGTPAYMSPEQQTSAHAVTAASDIYSLGAVMYELFTGRKAVGRFRRPRELDPSLPEELEGIILRCLESNPEDRHGSADEIKDQLLLLLRGAHLASAQKERAGRAIATGDKFALLDVIKEDRYGSVYLYENRSEQSLMVVKRRPAGGTGYTEAKLLTTLKHPNIVNVLGTSKNDQSFILVMEYVSGGSLKDRLIQPLPWGDALKIAGEICAGLAFAHRNRIVHGNLRPSNVLFTQDGTVKVADFGLEEHYGRDLGNWYNDPGEPRSPRADVLAAGTILHQMLTGQLPAWRNSRLVPHEHLEVLPAQLQGIIQRMLERDPGKRYASCDPVVTDIGQLLRDWSQVGSSPTAGESDDATLIAEEAGFIPPPASAPSPSRTEQGRNARPSPRRTRLRPLPTLALVLVLAVVVTVYLGASGELEIYLSPLQAAWEAFVAQSRVVMQR